MEVNHFSKFGILSIFAWEEKNYFFDPIVLNSGSLFQVIHVENPDGNGFVNDFHWNLAGMNDDDFCFECLIPSGEFKGEMIDRDNFKKWIKEDSEFFKFIVENSKVVFP